MTPPPDSETPQYAPDEVNQYGEYIKIGGSPIPGLTLRHILRGHTSTINRIAWSPDGKYVASPSDDSTIRIWDMNTGECVRILEGHDGNVYCVAWSPNGQQLASGSSDKTVQLWNSTIGERLYTLTGHAETVDSVAWSPNSKQVASASHDRTIRIWSPDNGKQLQILEGHSDWVLDILWSKNSKYLLAGLRDTVIWRWHIDKDKISNDQWQTKGWNWIFGLSSNGSNIAIGSGSNVVEIWNIENSNRLAILEGHTKPIGGVSFSSDGYLFATKSLDHEIRIWNTFTWSNLALVRETTTGIINPWSNLLFHPHLPILATLGEKDSIIRIWEYDEAILLGQAKESVNYTTAKLVLVGDSGVGKTGLGWRLAHGEFKEHASTHGQQFWSVPKLNLKRKDGTDCEAVLWDLAGQHVYRQVHSIFLDNVAAALVLFDPTNRQEPLKGAQFWLEQLKGKGELPPTVLVGARVDRGAPALSQAELDQFCQRYGIKGGYISTSALKGDGLDELMEIIKQQIPWDEMTATVTTVTFKRIKDYVLALKEKTDRKGVLVSPAELRRLLETTSEVSHSAQEQSELAQTSEVVWQFTDDEMMTAVGHLDTHGYVSVLRNVAGQATILLTPDLLVNLAASIMLLADKNPRELGAVSETELLQGKYPFDELKGLEPHEAQTLLDAAILRFLEHNICFRSTFNDDTLLIFPSLIKQKRPLQDDAPATDDISYVVRGRVENLYASLVVLLGYTPSFSRINQWQNQAQYEIDSGQVCGFRSIEEREGELELVLYYGDNMPRKGREQLQELFEQFLYQREVDVTRFPPVACKNQHRIERATVVKRVREGKDFVFCDECGEKTFLPDFEKSQSIGLGASAWLQREEAAARLRSSYEKHLTNIKSYRRGWAMPRAYLSRLPEQNQWAEKLIRDLRDAGVYVLEKADDVKADDFVLVLNTTAYEKAFKNSASLLTNDIALLRGRLGSNNKRTLSLGCEGQMGEHDLDQCRPGDFCNETHYPVSLFDLVLNLYAIPFTHKGFEPLRKSLHEQWEQTLGRLIATEPESPLKLDHLPVVKNEEKYFDFDLHITPNGHIIASSPEGEATSEIPTQLPKDIQLSLQLIQVGGADADLLKAFGKSLYEWLFPSKIHTHFHQTEAIARVEQAKLRLRLRIEAESIARLPLEFLYREEGDYYLATNPDTVLSRYLNLPLPPGRIRRHEGPLHILVILSEPSDQGKFDPAQWDTMFRESLSARVKAGELTIQTIERATRKEIRNALLQQKPDIVQYVGHGIYKDGKGHIALLDDETGKTWLVDDTTFANIFNGYDDHLGLISLTACESAESASPQAFNGIAPRLVQRGTPAVIAMQYKVQIKTANVFFEDFYTSLAAAKPVDWAMQSARNAVALKFGQDNREFGTPVLYMRAEDGVILSRKDF